MSARKVLLNDTTLTSDGCCLKKHSSVLAITCDVRLQSDEELPHKTSFLTIPTALKKKQNRKKNMNKSKMIVKNRD